MIENNGNILHTVRPSIIALFVSYLKVIIPLLIFHLIILNFFSPELGQTSMKTYQLLCILYLLEMVRRYYNHIYYFREEEISHAGGRISFRLKRINIKYIDIRETRVFQTILGRILNYGTVFIGTAATAREELICARIDHPQQLADYIQEMISKNKNKLSDSNNPEDHPRD